MADMNRREVVGLIAAAPLAAAFPWTAELVREASARAREALARGTPYEPKQFTPHEWETVRALVDLIIPKDERSGSATEAGVPEFMDFMLGDDADLQTPMRGGLAWLDRECDDRYGKTFVACASNSSEAGSTRAFTSWRSRACGMRTSWVYGARTRSMLKRRPPSHGSSM